MPEHITFVTCFKIIYSKEPYQHKTLEWRLSFFEKICQQNISICIYCCPITRPHIELLSEKYPNIKIMELLEPIENNIIHKTSYTPGLSYPERRNDSKDNTEYMSLMHDKIVYVYDAIQQNPWNTRIFAWFDVSMAYLFKNMEETLLKLRNINENNTYVEDFTVFPGCWSPITNTTQDTIFKAIHWRFCGTFFMGNNHSLEKLYEYYCDYYPLFVAQYKKIVWEVNFWAWLEYVSDWKPIWYSSDHNDRIIDIPNSILISIQHDYTD
jgi:hypothetical protein